ncbi:MAG: D-glycero-beta-D-manno-heptose 1-phosphate adenylyltransferase [Paracoccaceae bacterium]
MMRRDHFSNGFGARRVLCIGDVMLDRFHYGEVSRISPEAPVPVLKLSHTETMLGGAANTAANISTLGGNVDLAAPLGEDEAGREFAELIRANGRMRFSAATDPRGTIVKSRYSANGQQLLRIDHEDPTALSPNAAAVLEQAVLAALPECDIVVLSDYAKGALSPALCQSVIAAARRAGRPVVVDPKGSDFSRYRGASVVTPNERELAAALGRAPVDDDDLASAAADLARRFDLGWVAVTRGRDGVTLVAAEGAASHIPSFAREVFDVSGAGDSFVAGLVCALATGQPMADAVRYGNAVAGVAVGKAGTAVVWPREVLHLLDSHATTEKVDVTRDYGLARDVVDGWRAEGLRVGFTNGVFDLLHRGHLQTLRAARRQCDRLIVGINSDASVRRLKGPTRPVQDEDHRAEVLAAMEVVDLVVIFDEDTPLDLIQTCAPDFLVKGGDYRAEDVVGHDFIRSRGGRVIIVPILDGYSTTAQVARIGRPNG